MPDRKPRRHGSSPHASVSGSIRIGASGLWTDGTERRVPGSDSAARSLTHGESPSSIVEDFSGPSSMSQGNAMLFLVAGVCTSVFTITGLATGRYDLFSTSALWLLLVAALSWSAFALRRRGWQTQWAVLIGIASINSLMSTPNTQSSVLMSGMLVILMWSGIILRPRYNVVLASYALLAIFVTGGELQLSTSGIGDDAPMAGRDPGDEAPPHKFAFPILFTYLAVPLGLGATLHLREQTAKDQLRASIAKLEQHSAELVERLEGKSNELELSREQLFEAQKLKTVGTMASGLAHELNNILTPIRGHAELIAEGVPNAEQTRRYGQRILDSAAAAAHITGTLLTYARQGTFQPVRSNLRQLLQGQILPVLSKSLPTNVRLKVDLARSVSVDVDRVLLQQAIANLVFNAVDAMPEGGEITVGLTTSSLPASSREGDEDLKSGHGEQISAVIEIGDSGTGIDDEHLAQIFDPFFTTKAVGSGSGLGLAMVMGTVTRHHGRVSVASEIGDGTTFRIWLPLATIDERSRGPQALAGAPRRGQGPSWSWS